MDQSRELNDNVKRRGRLNKRLAGKSRTELPKHKDQFSSFKVNRRAIPTTGDREQCSEYHFFISP
jgi:hypothetical protein